MSLNIKKSLELMRMVLGERPEVRNCRFDEPRTIKAHSTATTTMTGETVVYPVTLVEYYNII
jgi:hypothetical protein